jgi:hypothetical protein
VKVFIDLDGVLSAFTTNLVRTANEIWPNKLPLDYVPSDWDYIDVFTKEDWSVFWETAKKIPDFWLRQTPIVKNLLPLQKWIKTTKHQIFYITSRIETGGISGYEQSAQWLIRQHIYPPTAQLIVVPKSTDKKKYIIEYNIDFGIDDLPATVADLNLLPWHTSYLLDQPYNQNSNQGRVQSLQEFLDIVDSSAQNSQGE